MTVLSHVQLCDPTDFSPLGSSVHGILQARMLECVAISFSGGSSWPSIQTRVACIAGRFFTLWDTRKSLLDTDSLKYVVLYSVLGQGCRGKTTAININVEWVEKSTHLVMRSWEVVGCQWVKSQEFFEVGSQGNLRRHGRTLPWRPKRSWFFLFLPLTYCMMWEKSLLCGLGVLVSEM